MTIRIINHDPHSTVVKQTVCSNCGVTLEYTPSDVQTDYSSNYTGGRDYFNFISCPKCDNQVKVR